MEIFLFNHPRKNATPVAKPPKGLTKIQTAEQLLSEGKRPALLQAIKKQTDLDVSAYEALCLALLKNFAQYCQNLPEISNSFYSQLGGLIDHSLNKTEAALGLFQKMIVLEKNELSQEQKLWQYALYSAAILQGIGKLYVDFDVALFDLKGQALKIWDPLLESLHTIGSYYDYSLSKDADSNFRRSINLLLAKALMPSNGFTWIASNKQVLTVWLALINEDMESAGTLGAILIRAEAVAIQKYYAGIEPQNPQAPNGPLGRAGTFAGGVSITTPEKEQAIGIAFLDWLIKALAAGQLIINKGPILSVPGGLIISDETFKFFLQEHPEFKNWQAVQKGFMSLGLHKREAKNTTQKGVENNQGLLISDYHRIMPKTVSIYNPEKGTTKKLSALEFIHQVFINQPQQHLSALGTWQEPSEAPHENQKSGIKARV